SHDSSARPARERSASGIAGAVGAGARGGARPSRSATPERTAGAEGSVMGRRPGGSGDAARPSQAPFWRGVVEATRRSEQGQSRRSCLSRNRCPVDPGGHARADNPNPEQPVNLAHAKVAQLMIPVDDFDKGVAFYRDTLGIPFLFAAPPQMAFFNCGGI